MTTRRRAPILRTMEFETLADLRQVRMVCSTESVGRDKLILVSRGLDLRAYRNNPIWLWQHNPEHPIARSLEIDVDANDRLVALVQFPPEGVSPKADEIFGLCRSMIINAASTGFNEIACEPIDPANTRAGWRVTEAELLEMSFVSIPADPAALAVERDAQISLNGLSNGDILQWIGTEIGQAAAAVFRARTFGLSLTCCGATDLPIAASDRDWDPVQAADRVFELAGFDGDAPDVSLAQRAFACMDTSAPMIKNSYRMCFADVVDGELRANPVGIAAVSLGIDSSGLPDDIQTCVRALVEKYQTRASTDDTGTRNMQLVNTERLRTRGIYDLGQLAYTLAELGYQHELAAWEADVEKDLSVVPAMLADAMRQVADALLAMTAEEVGELLARLPAPAVIADMPVDDVADLERAATPVVRGFLLGWYRARAVRGAAERGASRPAASRLRYHRRMARLV